MTAATPSVKQLVEQLIRQLQDRHWNIRCVESCTAGALTAAIGSVSGASTVLDRSWVTYSNQAKHEEIGVPLSLLETYGAVSEEVVLAMAEGAVNGCEENTVSISVSGIAGPDGGTTDKPVGTVWIGIKLPPQTAQAHVYQFKGPREQVQAQAVHYALKIVVREVK